MALAPEKLAKMLLNAILKNDGGGVASLISMGADPNISDAKGNSMAVIAATDPREHGALQALIEAGADLNRPSANGKLPLHSVLRMKDDRNMLAAIELLLAARADPNLIERREGEPPMTPLQVALVKDRGDKIVERLLRSGANATLGEEASPLHVMARQGRYAMIEAAHLCGADINARDAEGRTCLMWAARVGAGKTVETLLECGADIALKDKQGMDAPAHARAAPTDVDFRPIVKIMMQASNDQGLRKEIQDLRDEVESLRRAITEKIAGS